MADAWKAFEGIARRARKFTEAPSEPTGGLHPFDARNIHERVSLHAKNLFDDGHFPQATFEAYKFVDKEVQRHSKTSKSGKDLMMQAFRDVSPAIQLTPLSNKSEIGEQEGYRFLFAGSIIAIRNPRGHELAVPDTPDKCLDHLSLASMLIRRLEESGFK